MSRLGKKRRTACLAPPLGVVIALAFGPASGRAQQPAGVTDSSPAPPATSPGPVGAAVAGPAPPASAAAAPASVEAVATLPDEVQVVRFEGPAEARIEVLGPPAEPVPVGPGGATGLFGLKVGVGYQLRLTNLPGRPGAELYPVIEIVGHLHRPAGMDPTKFPIRVAFTEDDFEDAVQRGRLVTQVIYLEDPETALPVHLPKQEIPVVTLNPVEEPLKVASALGRIVAIVRTGGRQPSPEELNAAAAGGSFFPGTRTPCPFAGTGGTRCALPCGPGRGTPPPQRQAWLPRDEYLCDGGDHAEPIHFGGDGALRGIDPRDAVIRFSDDVRPRVLPTNMVCIYAPRFAEVRVSTGPNEALAIQGPVRTRYVERQALEAARAAPSRLVQHQAAEANRLRARASALRGRVYAGETTELRVLSGFDSAAHLAGLLLRQKTQDLQIRQKAVGLREKVRAERINTAESAVVTGVVEGAGEMVMAWPARETVGVEVPPKRPGLAVIKRVSTGEAEPGDVVTYVIQYRNMGNTPIRAVSVIDSLLPRLAYVPGSARGPAGTVFTAAENRAGSTELRWDLPGAIPPGGEGHVTFEVQVR